MEQNATSGERPHEIDRVVPHSVPWIVSNAKKILAGMRKNPRNWRMEDLEVVARRFGVDVDSQGGTSHVTFRHPRAARTTVPKRIPIKPWYVRDFVTFISKLEDLDHE